MINVAHGMKHMVQHKGAGQGTNMFKGTISKVMSISARRRPRGQNVQRNAHKQGADQWIKDQWIESSQNVQRNTHKVQDSARRRWVVGYSIGWPRPLMYVHVRIESTTKMKMLICFSKHYKTT